ncbi:ABC transporter ATP-binding protein [Solirubrobacter phytolaccae]|uniref:ABC transporter ATP-binding protein n=1 Tax=Solirubrobacter phytolaccae TaxID=1404360 RepID=A0A9X3N8B2_9ACTN|nr:ABC transporter ATP-binding protein [Solirubrobacter phytolaccae]MDA0181588.1 ABC transporter ATP-binding protein [Solirubrobacter phytolaccae]
MIATTALSKRYGEHLALDDVALRVPEGSVYGLAGRNGAGKTTLIGILAGLRRATSGEVRIDAPPERVAVLADAPRFDPWLTGREVVALAQQLTDPAGDIDGVLDQAGLTEAKTRRVGGYSRGMLQRLGVAAAIVGRPRLLLLDEPASALDPQGRREVLDLIARLRGTATVLFSSHILGDVQEVCDTVGVLDHGRLRFQGPLDELLVGAAGPRYEVRLRGPAEPVAEALRRHPWVTHVETGPERLTVGVTAMEYAEAELPGALAAADALVVSFGPEELTLERAFLALTR